MPRDDDLPGMYAAPWPPTEPGWRRWGPGRRVFVTPVGPGRLRFGWAETWGGPVDYGDAEGIETDPGWVMILEPAGGFPPEQLDEHGHPKVWGRPVEDG